MLDTCAFIDAVTEPDNLGTDVCALMEDYENEFCISIETIREVILKYKNNHLIISHALTNKMPLISRDRKFQFYKKQGLDLIYYGN